MAFKMKSRIRSSISLAIVLAMMTALVPGIVFATPIAATGTLTAGGTTKIAAVTGTASNGLNGVHSLEVTGTLATKSKLTGLVSAAGVAAGQLGALNPAPATSEYTTLKVTYDGVDTTLTGLSAASTVADVVNKIASQVPSVTTGFVPVWGYAYVESKQVGPIAFSISGAPTIINAVFGMGDPAAATLGLDYAAFGVIDKFTPVDGAQVTLANAAVGYVDGSGAFKTGIDPASKLYTAAKLDAGYDFVLATGKTYGFDAIGLASGFATVTAGAGTRDASAPWGFSAYNLATDSHVVEAGAVTTMVAEIWGPNSAEATAVIDQATLTLPAGFSVATTSVPTVLVNGSTPASATLSGNTVSLKNFAIGSGSFIVVTIPQVTAATVADDPTTADDDYKFTGTYKNTGSTKFLSITGDAPDSTNMWNNIHVAPVNKVTAIDLKASGNRAGGVSRVTAHLYDKYMNEIRFGGSYSEWDKTVTFSDITTPALSPAGAFTGGTSTNIFDVNYGYNTTYQLSTQVGTTTIQAVVAGEATKTVSVSTVGVGEPAKLVVTSEKNPVVEGTNVRFHVGVVDANGKETSYLAADKWFRLFYGPGGSDNTNLYFPAKYSEAIVTSDGLWGYVSPSSWDLWAVDYQNGALTQSDILKQTWTAKPSKPGVYYGLKVTASPVVPVREFVNWVWYSWVTNDGSWGYAPVGSPITFKVQAVDDGGMPVIPTTPTVVKAVDNDGNQPGVIGSQSATLGPDGSATFTVTSTFPNGLNYFNQWVFSDANTGAGIQAGYGYSSFYAPEVTELTADRGVVLADGKAMATLTAKVLDPITETGLAGQTVVFSTGFGDLSSTTAVTDANGVATVTITSSKVGGAEIWAKTKDGNSGAGCDVDFTAYQAVLVGTASANGAIARNVRFQIKDVAGNIVKFKANSDWDGWGAGGDARYYRKTFIETDTVKVEAIVDYAKAGTLLHAYIYGTVYVDAPGSLYGYTPYEFSGDLPITVATEPSVQVVVSQIPGVYGKIVASGLYPDSSCTDVYVLPVAGVTQDERQVSHIHPNYEGRDQTDAYGDEVSDLAPGTYDVSWDNSNGGWTLASAAILTNSPFVGYDPVAISLGSSTGSSFVPAGTLVNFVGVVGELDGDTVQQPLLVTLQKQAPGAATWTNVATVLTDVNGGFKFAPVKVSATTNYKVVSAGSTRYIAGDSAQYGLPLTVNVKTVAALKVTAAPTSILHGRTFTVKASLPSHFEATTARIYLYQKVGTRWVVRASYGKTIPVGATSFSVIAKAATAGSWAVRAYHADANHVASWSAYRAIAVK